MTVVRCAVKPRCEIEALRVRVIDPLREIAALSLTGPFSLIEALRVRMIEALRMIAVLSLTGPLRETAVRDRSALFWVIEALRSIEPL